MTESRDTQHQQNGYELIANNGFHHLESTYSVDHLQKAWWIQQEKFPRYSYFLHEAFKQLMYFINTPYITPSLDKQQTTTREDFIEEHGFYDKINFNTLFRACESFFFMASVTGCGIDDLTLDIYLGKFTQEQFEHMTTPERIIMIETIVCSCIKSLQYLNFEVTQHHYSEEDAPMIFDALGIRIEYLDQKYKQLPYTVNNLEELGISIDVSLFVIEILESIVSRPMMFDDIVDNADRIAVRQKIAQIYGSDVYLYYEKFNRLKFNNTSQIYQMCEALILPIIEGNMSLDAQLMRSIIYSIPYFIEYCNNDGQHLRDIYDRTTIEEKIAIQQDIQSVAAQLLAFFTTPQTLA